MRRFRWYVALLLDRMFGMLIGQPCDLCREMTLGVAPPVYWCVPCTLAEFRRFGL